MKQRFADRVTVPDVVGLPFLVGRDVTWESGVSLANPDPDGPPIGALAWPGLFYITSQRPAAGTIVYRWDSVAVEVVAHGDAESNAWLKRPDAPPVDSAHATTPQPEQRVDLTETDPPLD